MAGAIRVHEAYDTEEVASQVCESYGGYSPVRDCYVRYHKLSEKDAMELYKKPEIWVVSGEYYSGSF